MGLGTGEEPTSTCVAEPGLAISKSAEEPSFACRLASQTEAVDWKQTVLGFWKLYFELNDVHFGAYKSQKTSTPSRSTAILFTAGTQLFHRRNAVATWKQTGLGFLGPYFD